MSEVGLQNGLTSLLNQAGNWMPGYHRGYNFYIGRFRLRRGSGFRAKCPRHPSRLRKLKDPVKDKIIRYGLLDTIDHRHFYHTIDTVVAAYYEDMQSKEVE